MAVTLNSLLFNWLVLHLILLGLTNSCFSRKCHTLGNISMPQMCFTPFSNVAYGKQILVSNSCGSPPSKYCLLRADRGPKTCRVCNATSTGQAFPARYITDGDRSTWWQSQTLLSNKKPIWMTINFGKSYEITYISITFKTMRPKSFKISKKINVRDASWIPYQYYSSSCLTKYGVLDSAFNFGSNQNVALCTSKYSGLIPLTNGKVSFSTLAGRRGSYDLDNNPQLLDWITAVAIRIDLDEMNTFGDEIFGEETVLRSYYYGITNLEIAGRCKCNGHASECSAKQTDDGKSKLVCHCQHGTQGDDCDECAPLYNDKPWKRATPSDANACARCKCNGMADACVSDKNLYSKYGRGGRCINCRNNTDGINCEKCQIGYHRKNSTCSPCQCGILSKSLDCNTEGKCECLIGAIGDKCQKCQSGYILSAAKDTCIPSTKEAKPAIG